MIRAISVHADNQGITDKGGQLLLDTIVDHKSLAVKVYFGGECCLLSSLSSSSFSSAPSRTPYGISRRITSGAAAFYAISLYMHSFIITLRCRAHFF